MNMIMVRTLELHMSPVFDGEADVWLAAYTKDSSPALKIFDANTGEPLYSVTIWIDVPRSPRCAFIKDHAENRGILEELIKHRLLEPTGKVGIVGGIKFPECKLLLTEEQWATFDKLFPKRH
jgi:hypothetical protein